LPPDTPNKYSINADFISGETAIGRPDFLACLESSSDPFRRIERLMEHFENHLSGQWFVESADDP
jgi:hypothetical protein